MKRINNKGFTLVEVLAMLIVLGILMAITVPNITGILNQQKDGATVDDASRLVSSAQTIIATKREIARPISGNCKVLFMNYLDSGDDYNKTANGGEYLRDDSFVIVKREGSKMLYYVRLVEKINATDYYGIELSEIKELEREGTVLVTSIEEPHDLSGVKKEDIKSRSPEINRVCGEIEEVYR